MLRDIIAMIAIQTPDGMLFGTARRFDGETLHCEIDADILPGTLVEWRMELPGLDDTALGKMRIIGVQRVANSGVRIWSGAIVAVDTEDEEVFSVWKRGVDEGSRSFSKSRHSGGQVDWLSGQTTSGASPAERARAMAQQDERRKRRAERARQLAKNAKAWPDPEEREASAAIGQEMFRSQLSGSVSGVHPVNVSGSHSKSSSTSVEYSRPRAQVAETLREHMRRAVEQDSARQPTVAAVVRAPTPSAPAVEPIPTAVAAPPAPVPVATVDASALSPEEIAAAAKAAGVRGPPRSPEVPVSPPLLDPALESTDDPPSQPPAFIGGIAGAVERVKARSQNQGGKRSKSKDDDAKIADQPVISGTPLASAPAKSPPKRTIRSRPVGPVPPGPEIAPSEPFESDITVTPESPVQASAPQPPVPSAIPADPVVHADKGMLSIWFVSAAAYRSQLASLRAGRIELVQDGLGAPGTPVQVYLRVPSGVVLPLSGSIIFSGGGMTGLRLNLDASSQKLVEMG